MLPPIDPELTLLYDNESRPRPTTQNVLRKVGRQKNKNKVLRNYVCGRFPSARDTKETQRSGSHPSEDAASASLRLPVFMRAAGNAASRSRSDRLRQDPWRRVQFRTWEEVAAIGHWTLPPMNGNGSIIPWSRKWTRWELLSGRVERHVAARATAPEARNHRCRYRRRLPEMRAALVWDVR